VLLDSLFDEQLTNHLLRIYIAVEISVGLAQLGTKDLFGRWSRMFWGDDHCAVYSCYVDLVARIFKHSFLSKSLIPFMGNGAVFAPRSLRYLSGFKQWTDSD
jgi:hypothetical protein